MTGDNCSSATNIGHWNLYCSNILPKNDCFIIRSICSIYVSVSHVPDFHASCTSQNSHPQECTCTHKRMHMHASIRVCTWMHMCVFLPNTCSHHCKYCQFILYDCVVRNVVYEKPIIISLTALTCSLLYRASGTWFAEEQ